MSRQRKSEGRSPLGKFVVHEVVAEKFIPLPLEAQQIDGMLGDRMRINIEGRLLRVDLEALLFNFSNRTRSDDLSVTWVGEHAGKFLDAACIAVQHRNHEALWMRIERVAQGLMAAQDEDGYLGTYVEECRWTGWDVWTHKYTLIGLLRYHSLTGSEIALKACRKIGDVLVRTFGDEPGKRDINAAGTFFGMAATSVLEPICLLYRFTGEKKYLEFAHYIVRAYERPEGVSLVKGLLAHGSVRALASQKAYEMLSNLNGIVDLYRLTGDKALINAATIAWEDIQRTQLYPTGTVSAMELFRWDEERLMLPSSNIGETCVTVSWLQFTWRLFRLTAESRFGAELERTLYNHLLAAQDQHTGDISYYTALSGKKEFTPACLCCVSSGPRGISLIPQLVCGTADDDVLVVNLFCSGNAYFKVADTEVRVDFQTRFPIEGAIEVGIYPEREAVFSIRFRVPEWSTNFKVTSSAGELRGAAGQMLEIRQKWTEGSHLSISMDLPTVVVPLPAPHLDHVLLKRGPQIMALEASINSDLLSLYRTGLVNEEPELRAVPHDRADWRGGQIYAVKGLAGVIVGSDQIKAEETDLNFVPFAEAVTYTTWLARMGQMPATVPALTAYSRVTVSHVHLPHGFMPDGELGREIIAEHITDEQQSSFGILNSDGINFTSWVEHGHPGKGGEVWIAASLNEPTPISRVVFRHGALSAKSAWFDTSVAKPRVEIATAPVPVFSINPMAFGQGGWRPIGVLESYPRTSEEWNGSIAEQVFEIVLPENVEAYGIRIVGKPISNSLSCSELSAYA